MPGLEFRGKGGGDLGAILTRRQAAGGGQIVKGERYGGMRVEGACEGLAGWRCGGLIGGLESRGDERRKHPYAEREQGLKQSALHSKLL
jgi:hypothetical protein